MQAKAGWSAGVAAAGLACASGGRGAVSRVPGTWLAAPPTLFQLRADGLTTDGELMRKRGNIQPDTPGACRSWCSLV